MSRDEHYTCEECGELIEGADYDHAPSCPSFPAVSLELEVAASLFMEAEREREGEANDGE